MDARNFFDVNLPPFHRNQFGASGGGPIIKGKTFIFVDYEAIRQDQSLSFHDTVPSAAARAGSLCSTPNGTCTPHSVTVSPLVTPYLGFYPLPNGGLIGDGDTGVFNGAGLARFFENYVSARGDHKFSEKDSLAASWFYDKGPFTAPDALVDVIDELLVFRETASAEETHVFSPMFVNATRFGYSRSVGWNNHPFSAISPLASDTSLGAVPGLNAPMLTVPGLTLMDGALGDVSETLNYSNSFQFYDDAFLTRGAHSLKFGFSFERIQYDILNVQRPSGTFTFPSLAGFLQDQPTNANFTNAAMTQEGGYRQALFGGYLQDDWHWRPNLVLNLGVRYEPMTLGTEAHNRLEVVEDFYSGGPVPVKTMWAHNQTLLDFSPRVGFSWDPFHNGKTAIRGGFGIYNVLPVPQMWAITTSACLPFAFAETVSNLLPGSFPTGVFNTVGWNPKLAYARYIEQDPHRTYAMNWNLNIQRAITPSWTAMIGSVGSHSVHQSFSADSLDMVLPTLTSAGYLWPFPVGSGKPFNPNMGQMRGLLWDDSGTYEGLQAQVTKRMGYGIQGQASYTWGKCLDMGSGSTIGQMYLNSINALLAFDHADRRGLCDYNVGHNLVLNYTWDIPHPRVGGAVAQYILGGWETGGIFTASTGTPMTVLMAGNPTGQGGTPYPLPDRLWGPGCEGNPVNPGNPNDFLKLNCFSPPVAPASFAAVCQPAAASVAAVIPNTCMNLFGNAGRNPIIGPGLAEFDFSLFKNIPVRRISENFNVQFRAEFFNIFNRANFQSPIDNETIFNANGTPVSGAGAIDATVTTSRQIQFALKLLW